MNIDRKAKLYATAAHGALGQRRKYTDELYIVHPAAVAKMVAETPGATTKMIAAAWLHDVVEDTEISIVDIHKEFGEDVAKIVDGMTDISKPNDGNRAARKEIDRQYLSKQSAATQTIKLADLIHNSISIVNYDPKFAKVFMFEKQSLLKVLTKGDQKLYEQAFLIISNYYRKHGLRGVLKK